MKRRYKILILLAVSLGIYYPALFGEINSVDDYRMLVNLANQGSFDWSRLFLPSGGIHYRPLLGLSFLADKYLWDLTPSFMHLENMLLHAANAVWVFLLAQAIFRHYGRQAGMLPFWAALLYAAHPINGETVNWISGRTDLLAGFFILPASVLLIHAARKHSHLLVLLSGCVIGLGIMSKEMVVFFLPVAALLLWHATSPAKKGFARYSLVATLTLQYVVVVLVFLGLRFWLHGGGSIDLGERWVATGWQAAFTMLVNFGFYVKKLFIPWPLNFAIMVVDPAYVWLGGGALLLTILLVFFRNPGAHLVAASFLLVLPALILSLTNIAWTPVAERYLYLPVAFFLIGGVVLIDDVTRNVYRKSVLQSALVVILCVMVVSTVHRSLIWQSNLTLYEDTIRKSPDYAILKNELAVALLGQGRFQEADQYLQAGMTGPDGRDAALFVVNQAVSMMRQKNSLGARKLLSENCPDMETCSPEVLRMWARADENLLLDGEPGMKEELILLYKFCYHRSKDPFFRYRQGQLLLFTEQKQRAAEAFAEVYAKAAPDSYYRDAAGKLAARLKQELHD